jgi:hypothetical protein
VVGGKRERRERGGGGDTLNELIEGCFSFCCLRIDVDSKNEYL